MPKLNETGLKLTVALATLLGQTTLNCSDVEDAVITASGSRRKNLGKILQAILSNNMTAADCDCVEDGQIGAAVNRVMDESLEGDYVGDEDAVDTVLS